MHPDHRYIEALRRNDAPVIRQLYERFAAQARLWVLRNNGTADDARDVFQEALMALFELAADPDFVLQCPLGALLHRIYSRRWIDRLRQKGRDEAVRKAEERRYTGEAAPDAAEAAAAALEQAAENARLAAAFERLSDLCRQLLRLLSDGLTPAELARELQLNSVETLYRRKNACIQRWRALYFES